jgi:hypothetical protein
VVQAELGVTADELACPDHVGQAERLELHLPDARTDNGTRPVFGQSGGAKDAVNEVVTGLESGGEVVKGGRSHDGLLG